MNKPTAFIALACVLAAGYTAASHASQEKALVRALSMPRPVSDAGCSPVTIPANTLTGRGAIATPDGTAHF